MVFQDLENRLKKRLKQLRPWLTQNHITCFRVYDLDIPEWPLVIEYWEGAVVISLFLQKNPKLNNYESALKTMLSQLFSCDEQAIFIKYRGIQKGFQQYQKLEERSMTKHISEMGLQFEINLSDYLDVGLFLDHRISRAWCYKHAKAKRVLNLFCYTGSFSCYALAGGAKTCVSVDLNKNYCDWAVRNMALNGFELGPNNLVYTKDCLSFLKHNRDLGVFDLIICDPPTFSNSKKMEASFNVDEHATKLIELCWPYLAYNGKLLFSTNSKRFKLDANLGSKLNNASIIAMGSKTQSQDFKHSGHHCFLLKK